MARTAPTPTPSPTDPHPTLLALPVRSASTQRDPAISNSDSTHAITNTVKAMFNDPASTLPSSIIAGKRQPTNCTPAVIVVVMTHAIGASVTQAYLAFPLLIKSVVTRHRAITASSWLAMPNMGQIVSIDPVQIRAPQPPVTRAVESIAPGSQSV